MYQILYYKHLNKFLLLALSADMKKHFLDIDCVPEKEYLMKQHLASATLPTPLIQ